MPRRIDITNDGTVTKNTVVEEGNGSVTYGLSITKNLGGYESLKIQASITIPHGASDDMLNDLDKLIVVAKEKVVQRISSDIDDLTNSLT